MRDQSLGSLSINPLVHVITPIDDDDCAVFDIGGKRFVTSTDFINSSPAIIELGLGGYADLGRLVVAQNLSDLAGAGAKPVGLLLGVCLPRDTTEEDFKLLFEGAKAEADRYRVPILGGDTKVGRARSIYGVAIGIAERPESLLIRSQAKPGDSIWVSGPLGSFSAGVLALAGCTHVDESVMHWARFQITNPQVPLECSQHVSQLHASGAGTDITDGLWSSLEDICRSSAVGAVVEAESIPYVSEVAEVARSLGVLPWSLSFASGGDFQFLCCLNSRHDNDLKGMGLVCIGSITETGEPVLKLSDGRALVPKGSGHRSNRSVTFAEEIESSCRMVSNL